MNMDQQFKMGDEGFGLGHNPISAPKPLPIEVWSRIFENLKTSSEALLNCRQVCVAFKEEVSKKLARWVVPPELDPLPFNETPIKRLYATTILSLGSMRRFQQQMENQEDNPFPTRTLTCYPKCCPNITFCSCHNRYDKCVPFFEFSKRFGKHVHNLKFFAINSSSVNRLNDSVFQNFPNLRQLEIKLVIPESGFVLGLSEYDFGWFKQINLHPLPHLTHLKLYFRAAGAKKLIANTLSVYGGQLKSLSVTVLERTSSFKNVPSDIVPNLTNLKLQLMPELEPKHALNFLKNGNWQLKQLTLSERNKHPHHCYNAGYQLSDMMDIICKFASTLEILHLYFSNDSRAMYRLNCLSKPNKCSPEQVANELKLSVKLPFVRELSLPIGCIRNASVATARLCEKFENLKQIHMLEDESNKPNLKVNYEKELKAKWWPFLSPTSKLEHVIIFRGNQFDDNALVYEVITKPVI